MRSSGVMRASAREASVARRATISGLAVEGGLLESALESRSIAGKELTQFANRKSFHLEKALFAGVTVVIFLMLGYRMTRGWRMDIEMMSRFGRETFIPVSVGACVILSLASLASATGTIMSEAAGKRLDLLRVTPLSLATIVIGKGVGLFVRMLLVMGLLLPVFAATQLLGGVSAADVLFAVSMTAGAIFFSISLGLFISAGARTVLDRTIRSAEAAFLWLVGTGIVGAIGIGFGGRTPDIEWQAVAGASPLVAWGLHLEGDLSVFAAASNVLLHVVAGLWFLRAAIRSLARAVLAAQEAPEEPKVKDIFRGLQKLRIPLRLSRLIHGQREWVGTLIGSQLIQTSLAAVLLPMAAGFPQILMYLLTMVSASERSNLLSTYPSFIATTMGLSTLVMIAFQSAGALAREKSRHTAELVAVTPEGGAGMVWWKGAAIWLSQAPSLAISVFFILVAGVAGGHSALRMALEAAAFMATAFVVFALGMAFSLASRSAFEAVGLMAGSCAVAAPIAYQVIVAMVGGPPRAHGEHGANFNASVAIPAIALGLLLVGWRNVMPALARAALCVGTGLVLAGATLLLTPGREDLGILVPLVYLQHLRDPEVVSSLLGLCAVYACAGGAALWGCRLRFTQALLHGTRARD